MTTSKPEYVRSFTPVNNPSDELLCPICYDVVYEPLEHTVDDCQRIFCEGCISLVETCPMCRRLFEGDLGRAHRIIRNMIGTIDMECKVCQVVVKREFMSKHYHEDCPVECERCFERLGRSNLSGHVCPKEIICCSAALCDYTGVREGMDEHVDDCTFVKLECMSGVEEKLEFLVLSLLGMKKQIDVLNERVSELENQPAQNSKPGVYIFGNESYTPTSAPTSFGRSTVTSSTNFGSSNSNVPTPVGTSTTATSNNTVNSSSTSCFGNPLLNTTDSTEIDETPKVITFGYTPTARNTDWSFKAPSTSFFGKRPTHPPSLTTFGAVTVTSSTSFGSSNSNVPNLFGSGTVNSNTTNSQNFDSTSGFGNPLLNTTNSTEIDGTPKVVTITSADKVRTLRKVRNTTSESGSKGDVPVILKTSPFVEFLILFSIEQNSFISFTERRESALLEWDRMNDVEKAPYIENSEESNAIISLENLMLQFVGHQTKSKSNLIAQFHDHPEQRFLEALSCLCEDGFLYNTIDNEHFAVTF